MSDHILIVSSDSDVTEHRRATIAGAALLDISEALQDLGFTVNTVGSTREAAAALDTRRDISVMLLDWELAHAEGRQVLAEWKAYRASSPPSVMGDRAAAQGESETSEAAPLHLLRSYAVLASLDESTSGTEEAISAFVQDQLKLARKHNRLLPIFLWTDRLNMSCVPLEVLTRVAGYVWKGEDTPSFLAGRLHRASREFNARVTPTFFGRLVDYVYGNHYAWHTPGHFGGTAFLKSATGCAFHDFFGENMLRADLSVSVPQLGSLLDHTAAVATAEKDAAEVFGAEHTYFVTNGTSTSNQIVFHGTVVAGDVVLIDRNCHKSSMQAIAQIGCIPIFLEGTTNELGIVGPVPPKELTRESIRRKIDDCALIPLDRKEWALANIKLAVLTNSTYDGVCYDVRAVDEMLSALDVRNVLFDEAWFCYAHFHHFFANRYAMALPTPTKHPVFSTQSTHKVLAALSQASMIHVRGVEERFHSRFNEAFMMHTSTSPQYNIIASLDVAAKMLSVSGASLIEEPLRESLQFRATMEKIGRDLRARDPEDWWFELWQPDASAGHALKQVYQDDFKSFESAARIFCLRSRPDWAGFPDIPPGYSMLDPTKVTLYTDRIPGSVMSAWLRTQGIVVEKTGTTTFLVLFTIGITRGNLGALVSALFAFKKAYDDNLPVSQLLPDEQHHQTSGIKEFCQNLLGLLREAEPRYRPLPEAQCLPKEAYEALVNNQVEKVPIGEAEGRVAVKILLPYPPAIPLVMPGEMFTEEVVDHLKACERLSNEYPGFGVELHGVEETKSDGKIEFAVYCMTG